MNRIREKTNSERLSTTASGSSAAMAGMTVEGQDRHQAGKHSVCPLCAAFKSAVVKIIFSCRILLFFIRCASGKCLEEQDALERWLVSAFYGYRAVHTIHRVADGGVVGQLILRDP